MKPNFKIKYLLLICLLIICSCKSQTKSNDTFVVNDSSKIIVADLSKQEIDNSKNQSINKVLNDTFVVNDFSEIIILYPSKQEIDSLKNVLGEETFYTVADDENGYLSSIYNILDEQKIKYSLAKQSVIYFAKDNQYFNKRNIPFVWGVITIHNGKILFQNNIDFLLLLEDNVTDLTPNDNQQVEL